MLTRRRVGGWGRPPTSQTSLGEPQAIAVLSQAEQSAVFSLARDDPADPVDGSYLRVWTSEMEEGAGPLHLANFGHKLLRQAYVSLSWIKLA